MKLSRSVWPVINLAQEASCDFVVIKGEEECMNIVLISEKSGRVQIMCTVIINQKYQSFGDYAILMYLLNDIKKIIQRAIYKFSVILDH